MIKKKITEEYLLILFLISSFLFNIYNWKVSGIEDFELHFYVGFILMLGVAIIKFIVNSRLHQSTKYFIRILGTLFLANFLFSESQPLCQLGFIKMIISGGLLFFITILGFDIAIKSSEEGWKKVPYAALFTLLFFIASCFLEYFDPSFWPDKQHYRDIGLYSGVLGEPSFLGWSSATLLGLIFLGPSILKFIGTALWLTVCFVSPTATFLILSFSLLIYFTLIKTGRVFLALSSIVVIVTLLFLDITYFGFLKLFSGYLYERVVTVFMLTNIDSNIGIGHSYYAQGILDAWVAFSQSYTLGAGHNRMGCFESYDSPILDSLPPEDEPMARGAFLLAKIIYEWGLLGAIFISFIIYFIFRSSSLKRKINEEMSLFIIYISLLTWIFRSNVYTDHMYFIIALPPMLILMKKNKL